MVDLGPLAQPAQPYEQIAARIREAITSGALTSGEKLPSEAQLRASYGVARMTVRHALTRLAEEKLIISRPGIGWFVTERRGQKRSPPSADTM